MKFRVSGFSIILALAACIFCAVEVRPALAADCDPQAPGEFTCQDVLTMSPAAFDNLLERLHRLPGLDKIKNRRDFCEIQARAKVGDSCEHARWQYVVLGVNLALGHLSRDCCYEIENGRTLDAVQVANRVHRLLENDRCDDARDVARMANKGQKLTRCDGKKDDEDDRGDGKDDDDDDDDRDGRRSGQCDPRTQGYWKQQCSENPRSLAGYADDVRKAPEFRDVDNAMEICQVLTATGADCGASRAKLMATMLNYASGRLDPQCEVRQVGQNRGHETVRQAVRTASSLIGEGHNACNQANGILAPINSGGHLTGDLVRGRGGDEDDSDDGPGKGKGKDKSQDHGKPDDAGKGKGKGKDK